MPVSATRAALPAPSRQPTYEIEGRALFDAGRIAELITYAQHLAPLAADLEDLMRRKAPALRAAS